MKMYIYPKYMEEAAKTGWIVKLLRFLGVVQIGGCILLGVVVGGAAMSNGLVQLGIMSREAASASATLIGLAVGIIVGLFSSLVYFGLAQALDDLHAIRLQTGAYAAFETDNIQLGK